MCRLFSSVYSHGRFSPEYAGLAYANSISLPSNDRSGETTAPPVSRWPFHFPLVMVASARTLTISGLSDLMFRTMYSPPPYACVCPK